MRLLGTTSTAEFLQALDSKQRFDYLYAYPPRQAYRPFGPGADVRELTDQSLAQVKSYNLYVHFPFCRQICSFCNLYATVATSSTDFQEYADLVIREIASRQGALAGKTVRTIYFGGGTPSLFPPDLLRGMLNRCSELLGADISSLPEIAIEVSPATASKEQLAGLARAGFNRINLGVQTMHEREIRSIGRRDASAVHVSALRTSVATGFSNVCVDLIYGLPGQTIDSWRRTVDAVIEHRPETICAYPLTLRPGTGLDRRGYRQLEPGSYTLYDLADRALQSAGYRQQTHVRWALPRGGYLQKEYHWACEAVVGAGAGARSYLWKLDSRNGYSLVHRKDALVRYAQAVGGGVSPVTDGFIMDEDERRRKAVILGLVAINRLDHKSRFGADPVEAFPAEFDVLLDAGLVEITAETVQLSSRGIRHRDLAVQLFISDRVRRLVESFDYFTPCPPLDLPA